MPLCARCTAIYASYILLPLFYFAPKNLFTLGLSIFLQLPMLIDGLTQRWGLRESNNVLRVITGILSGIGQCLFIWFMSYMIIQILK
ncbi:hypothetical protein DL897_16190 [Thermoflavimicrobium daqui]|uniref:DUF2085 domain-containing protein n=2 Tax=Thermoflavimicrobium daqui TaxID=2137476 RepID=A0A364K1D8_9BACL|nr:hypothetical protein DL897_16190 [Thermoflavimicrobium daqui]